MNKLVTLSAALLLTTSLTQASMAQGRGEENGRGRGQDESRSDRSDRDQSPGKAKGKDREQGDRPGQSAERDRGDDRDRDREGRDNDGDDDDGDDNRERAERGDRDQGRDGRSRDSDRDDDNRERADRDRDDDRDNRVVLNRSGDRIFVVDRNRGLINGCPPGLAKRNNGCLPPGQERQADRDRAERDRAERERERARYDRLWNRQSDDFTYRYEEGYLYRYDRQGSLLGYLPALAGALGIGQTWPSQYRYEPAPSYYNGYYGLNDRYDYRYADGALYGVNPQNQSIQSIAALLTGQSPAVGQRMPAGYDVYNVPYNYRGQYADTADSAYRYNDGAVYQLDPTTQVVQAIIQLLT